VAVSTTAQARDLPRRVSLIAVQSNTDGPWEACTLCRGAEHEQGCPTEGAKPTDKAKMAVTSKRAMPWMVV